MKSQGSSRTLQGLLAKKLTQVQLLLQRNNILPTAAFTRHAYKHTFPEDEATPSFHQASAGKGDA